MSKEKSQAAAGEAVAPAETGVVTTPAPEKVPAAKPKKTAARSGDFCVYLGPTVIGVIQKGTVFRGSKDEVVASLSSAVEKYPLIPSLIVGSATLPEDRIKAKTPGNLLYVNYHKMLASGKK